MSRQLLQRWALAAAIFGVAVLARLVVTQVTGYHWPFLTFFPAVVAAAYYVGVIPAFAVLIASGLSGAYIHARAINSEFWIDIPGLFFFTVAAGISIILAARVHGQTEKLRAQDEQLRLINRELKHRIKNIFTITSAICVQTIKAGQAQKQMSEAIAGRIHAISAALERASVISDDGGDLRGLISDLVETLAPRREQLQVHGPAVVLPAMHTTPFALVLHELATNALKHGAWTAPDGTVVVRWNVERNGAAAPELNFVWEERRSLEGTLPQVEGLGSMLIREGLNGATVNYNLKSSGLECTIRLPV